MKECIFCGEDSPTLICLQCQDEKVTDETRDNSRLRNKFFWVCCPVCKRDRTLSYGGIHTQFSKEYAYPLFICKPCAGKLKTENRQQNIQKQRKPLATAEVNGCIIQEAKSGRCTKLCPDEKYLICLDKVIELNWMGFKKIG